MYESPRPGKTYAVSFVVQKNLAMTEIQNIDFYRSVGHLARIGVS